MTTDMANSAERSEPPALWSPGTGAGVVQLPSSSASVEADNDGGAGRLRRAGSTLALALVCLVFGVAAGGGELARRRVPLDVGAAAMASR